MPRKAKTKNTTIQYRRYTPRGTDTITCVVSGEVTGGQIKTILASLRDGRYFRPEQVGLPALPPQDGYNRNWWELDEDSFAITTEPATIPMDIFTIAGCFKAAKDNWDKDVNFVAVCAEEKAMNWTGHKSACYAAVVDRFAAANAGEEGESRV